MLKLVVLPFVLGLAAATPSGIDPFALAGLHAPWGAHLGAPLVAAHVAVAAPAVAAHNYRGPLSLAPGQPANVLAIDGRPLDTLSVNVDRAVHYTAKALDHAGGHWLRKRSASLLAAPVAWSHLARVDVPARVYAPAPLVAPLGLHGITAPVALGPLAHGHRGHW